MKLFCTRSFDRRQVLAGGAAIAAASAVPSDGFAQAYPARQLKFIVPYPAGGTTDILPRIMQDWLAKRWSQAIIVENKPGAAGNIGDEAAYNAEPDGYTVLVCAPSPFTVNQSLYPKLNFVPSEFVPVSIIATIPTALIVSPRIPANTIPEFIDYAKKNAAKLTVATQGIGTTSHLTSEWFQMLTGTQFVTVPYRGSAPALTDMMGGSVDLMFDNLGTSLQLVKSGQLKMIALATEKRMDSLPGVPTIGETLPDFVSATWVGVFLPPKTPQAIADRLNVDFNAGLKEPEIARRFVENGCDPLGTTPQAAAAFVRNEADRWSKVIKAANIKLQ
jgi:tripartite-type tricarboxylate transporter receptor subunit TctC